MTGRLIDIQDALVIIVRRLFEHVYRRYGSDKAHRDLIKLLMSNAYVVKMIGVGRRG